MESAARLVELAAQVDAGRLNQYLAALPGPRHRTRDGPAIDRTLEYLRQQFRGAGWEVADQSCHDEVLGEGTNVVATLRGSRDDALVSIGAHHDTVPGTPGADDNGSGLAGLLELARLLPRHQWEATIQLVAFDFEETEEGRFSGSHAYVAALERTRLDFRGAFVFEMIAYRSTAPGSQQVPPGIDRLYPQQIARLPENERRGDFIVALGNENGRGLLQQLAGAAALAASDLSVAPFPVPPGIPARDLFRSDHVPFWEAGLPAVMLTDTANFRNPHYHKPTDTPETLDAAFWRDVVAATLTAVGNIAVPK